MRFLQSRLARSAAAVALGLAVVVGVSEGMAWPFLAGPVQAWLSRTLARPVLFSGEAGQSMPAFAVRFFGGIKLQAARLEIAAPSWSKEPYLLQADQLAVSFRYTDLWRFYRGAPALRIELLQARMLQAQLERLPDGRASWQFGAPGTVTTPAPASASTFPSFGEVRVAWGTVRYRDQILGADVEARLSLAEGQTPQLRVDATGQYQKLPVKVALLASGALPWLAGDPKLTPTVQPVGVSLQATVGRANLKFDGEASDALALQQLTGRFTLQGPSLAAVGDPLGVTLPTTAAFRSEGRLKRQGGRWQVEVDDATIGTSQLDGSFVYDAERAVPRLSGRLGGARLQLLDLGPAFGATPGAADGKPKLLPTRPFDLAALRAMDADVRVDIAELNLNTRLLEPLRPLRGHLVLLGGVLTLNELDARTADGNLRGEVGLDGRQAPALWHADVSWNGVRLERWIRQEPVATVAGVSEQTVATAPPWVSGRLNGEASLRGQGVSTADILASMHGKARSQLSGGTVSHLAVEAAGIDIAQALSLLVTGDDALPVHCGVVDLTVAAGVVRPRVLVLDTGDSALWVTGTLSLASEQLDLRAVVAPKDFSPLTLRTPVRVTGTFAAPSVALEKGPLARKLAAAGLLALINPLAGLIPLLDNGNDEAAQKAAAGCQRLMKKAESRT